MRSYTTLFLSMVTCLFSTAGFAVAPVTVYSNNSTENDYTVGQMPNNATVMMPDANIRKYVQNSNLAGITATDPTKDYSVVFPAAELSGNDGCLFEINGGVKEPNLDLRAYTLQANSNLICAITKTGTPETSFNVYFNISKK